MDRFPRMLAAGDAAVTVEFGEIIDPEINDRVIAFADAVKALAVPGIIETVPTYRSATVYFDPIIMDVDRLIERLRSLAESPTTAPSRSPKVLEVPILYGGEYGPDLSDIATFSNLPMENVIALHTSVPYRVYMLGFSPGFPYLGRVPDKIAMPRLATPRDKVPAGSVGIAGSQTGIYPLESPGGWRLIGRTPLLPYDRRRSPPFLFEPGDQVRFVEIDQLEYDRLNRVNDRG
jgi:inhibitor of KinA